MSHSQLQQLAKNNHKRTKSESSFSSSSYYSSCSSSHQISPKVRTHILLHEYLQTSTTTTTTKNIKTSKDDHDKDHDHRFDERNITIPSCFSSFSPRQWSGLKLKCGGALSFMAASQSPVPVSSDVIKKKLSGHQKKAELERETSWKARRVGSEGTGNTDYSMVFSRARANRKQQKTDVKRVSLGNEQELIAPQHQDDSVVRKKKILTYLNCCIKP